eukprot:8226131-Ditylum_brightwellii.AAC.1
MATMVTTRSKNGLAKNLLNNLCLNKKQCCQEDDWWSPKIEISDKNKDEAEKMKTPAFMIIPLKKKHHLSASL